MSIQVHVLGSGSSTPSRERKNSSYLVEADNGSLLLLDCSGSPAHEVLARDRPLEGLSRVLLTHEHVDHCYALPSLIHGLWLTGARTSIEIWGPPSALAVGRQLIDAYKLQERKGAVEIGWRAVREDAPSQLDDLGQYPVASFPVTHGSVEAVAYRIGDVLFTGDCVVDDKLDIAASGVVDLVVDCGGGIDGSPGHAGASHILELCRRLPSIERVHLTHLLSEAAASEATDVVSVLDGRSVGHLRDGQVLDL